MQGDHHQSGQQSKIGRSGRNAPGPATQAGFTIEDHLRDSMQSPAVRMVGAYIIFILVLGGVAFLLPNWFPTCPRCVHLMLAEVIKVNSWGALSISCATAVTIGAVSVLLLILRTSMEDTKKFSPM